MANDTKTKRKAGPVVSFDTTFFQAAWCRAPKGFGTWAFCPRLMYRAENYLEHTRYFRGTYTSAKAQAVAAFKADEVYGGWGSLVLVVCS